MDLERQARRESRRVIISEIIMVVAVAIMVVILGFLVSGYWLGSDFKVERQGMLQISSVPTGASVEVDGDAPWFQRTNTSKVLSSGEHTVKLTKDGYDTWSRTVNIREGLLYRLHYPRLFPTERERETLQSFPDVVAASVSPNRKWLLLISNTTDWTLVDLDRDIPTTTAINVAPYLGGVATGVAGSDTTVSATDPTDTAGITDPSAATGAAPTISEVISMDWAADSEHVLLQVKLTTTTEWLLLNTKTPKDSINITREFAADFTKVRIFNNSASSLLAIRDSNLHRIDVSSRQISAVLAKNVKNYNFYETEIVFTATISGATASDFSADNAGSANGGAGGIAETTPVIASPASTETPSAPLYYIGLLKSADAEPILLKTSATEPTALLSHFYDDNYLTIIDGSAVTVYHRDDYALVFDHTISFAPAAAKVGYDGEFVFMNTGTTLATLDMESLTVTEWTAGSAHFGWLDGSMLYVVSSGTLSVYDFDGLNPRTLADDVASILPVTITADKWLYYFSGDHLVREWLVKR